MYFNKWGWWKDPFRQEANRLVEEQIAEGGIKEPEGTTAKLVSLDPDLSYKKKNQI